MYTIGITNNKGGGTKTTIANSLAQFYRENGLNVLLVDFDPQANTSSLLIQQLIIQHMIYLMEFLLRNA